MKQNQSGIALVMVLVLLVLMTLISATAIQQNRLQFAMVGNLQEQSQSFTRAESILRLAEQAIENTRWSAARTGNDDTPGSANNDLWRCKAAGGFYSLIAPGTAVGPVIAGATTTVTEWWCESEPATGATATCDVNDANCPTVATTNAAGAADGCGTELYTIRVQFTQQNNSAAVRTVESKYAIKCLDAE